MSANKLATPVVLTAMITIAGLAGLMVVIEPARALSALVAAAFLPSAVIILKTVGRFVLARGDTAATHGIIRASLLGAGLVLGGSLVTEIAQSTGMIDAGRWDIDELAFGVSLAGAMILFGWATEKAKKKS